MAATSNNSPINESVLKLDFAMFSYRRADVARVLKYKFGARLS